MSNPKHTPGPWSSDAYIIVKGSKRIAVAEEVSSEQETDANARLIAAAPELLAVLRECEDYLGATSANVNDPLWERVKELIAKATGGV